MLKKIFLPLFLALTFASQAFAWNSTLDLYKPLPRKFNEGYAGAMMADPAIRQYPQGQMPIYELVGVMNRAFDSLGYDFDDTVYEAVDGATANELGVLQQNGGMNVIGPIINAMLQGQWEIMVDKDYISEKTAKAVAKAYETMTGLKIAR